MLHKTIIYVNSKKRFSGGSSSDFIYEIRLDSTSAYDSVAVLQASIPVSFYLIQSGYNTFQIQEGASIATVTIPPGNYNVISFTSVVSSLMSAASPNGWVYMLVFGNSSTAAVTGKIQWSVSGNSSQPKVLVGEYVNEQLGFQANSVQSFVGNQLTSSNVVNMTPETTVFLRSDLVDDQTNVLQEIYAHNVQPFSFLTFLNPDPCSFSKRLVTRSSGVYHFWLSDENARPLFLNGLDMEITLVFYESSKLDDLLKLGLKAHFASSGDYSSSTEQQQ